MNGANKFHPPGGPAFRVGEQWIGGNELPVWITNIRKYGPGKWDADVEYMYEDGVRNVKDAWNFQVRFAHVADTVRELA